MVAMITIIIMLIVDIHCKNKIVKITNLLVSGNCNLIGVVYDYCNV